MLRSETQEGASLRSTRRQLSKENRGVCKAGKGLMCQRTGEGQHREAGTHAWGISDPGFCMPETRGLAFLLQAKAGTIGMEGGV